MKTITAASSKSYLAKLTKRFESYQPTQDLLLSLLDNQIEPTHVSGLSGSATSILLKILYKKVKSPILVVTTDPDEARDFYDDLVFLLGDEKVAHFPARQILPFDFRAPISEIIGNRISTLARLSNNEQLVIVTPARALFEPTITKKNLENSSILLKSGLEIEMDDLINKLVRLNFRRVPVVEEVGDFSVRGGLIDFFTPGSEAPIRAEFFGDEIDTLREFEVATQRTIRKIDQVSLLPKREIPITQESLEDHLEQLPEGDAQYIRSRYLNDPELPGLEWLSVLFDLPQGCLLDYFPSDGLVVLKSEGSIKAEVEELFKEADILHARLNKQLVSLPAPDKYYHSPDSIFKRLETNPKIDLLPFKGGRDNIIDFQCQPHPSFGSRLDLLGGTLKDFKAGEFKYFIATDTHAQKDRLEELISEKAEISFIPNIEVTNLKGGFVCQDAGVAILTDHEIFSRYHRRVRRKKFKEGVAISDYSNLNRGDYVVHVDYGISRFLGLETLDVDQRKRDCLYLEYANKDKLFVPIEEFNRVSKYSGKDSDPSLSMLGGPGWENIKKKTKKAIEIIAADLVQLYAERKAAPGYKFGEDTVWLKQLEASFIYEETRDQLRAIEDVKKDMETSSPMDRLICGDVGYGKTEVAVRAAFKAIENGKQVAILVPTTVLAQQHFQTFNERMADFPVRIDLLSRFRTRKEQLQTVDNLADGKVDLVIGTHRLLSKDIIFKDIGLLIVDEEHRFGVRHKEKLRKIKQNVDTISMTATPIPRTLQMSLMGVRDMSLITTSPKDRLPILTEIAEFDPSKIATTILREIDRGGQVFFVHNRVQTIDAMYQYLKKLIPQAEIAIAHGQMHERSLEGIMLGFMTKRFNVLLCTSIIESGLDIPSANTIIINRADRFGLAQLYQIRGRVGRSARRAYAYLLTPAIKLLKPDAIKRLRAIEAHADLGAGFALAMRDLEIRGSGSILGTKQSGFIEEIGYDMYQKMLDEAIRDLQGQAPPKILDAKLETDIETHLSNAYINDRQQKVDIYRRLADAVENETVVKIYDEVNDRFGKIPVSGKNLFDAAAIRVVAGELEIEKVSLKGSIANIFFKEGKSLKRSSVEAMHKVTTCPMEFSILERTQIIINLTEIDVNMQLAHLFEILNGIKHE